MDNITFHITKPLLAQQEIISLLNGLGHVYGNKAIKSWDLININLSVDIKTNLENKFLFVWIMRSWQHLGFHIFSFIK